MRRCRIRVVTTFGAWAVVASCAPTLAGTEELSLSDLVLKKTYLKATAADGLGLSGWQHVLSPTSITCPGNDGTCTARMTLSIELATFDYGGPGRVRCRGIRSGFILPNPPLLPLSANIYFGDDSGGFQASVLTFSWIARSLPLGAHTFSVQCRTTSIFDAPVIAGARTLTIDVYKP